MRTRRIIAVVIAVLTVPVVVLGLIDPLEGGLALIAAGGLVLGTRLLARVNVPRLEWIAWAVAIGVGAGAILLAVALPQEARSTGEGGLFSLSPVLITALLAYELAVMATIAGAVLYVVRLIRAVAAMPRAHRPA